MRRNRRTPKAGAASPRTEVDRLLQHIESLRHRSGRDHSGQFYVEGIRFLAQAAEQQAAIDTLVVSWKLLTNAFARQLVRRRRRAGTRTVLVTPEQFRAVSQRPRASGVGLVLRQQWTPIDAVDPHRGTAWLLFREVQAPGNLGTLLRSLAAVGGGGALFLGNDADPFDPAVVRATMGAIIGLQFARVTDAELRRLRDRTGCSVIGTSARADTDYTEVTWPPGAVIFLGGERKGLSTDDAALCDRMLRIPMTQAVDSLNLGVAGSLMLYEVLRGVRPKPG